MCVDVDALKLAGDAVMLFTLVLLWYIIMTRGSNDKK